MTKIKSIRAVVESAVFGSGEKSGNESEVKPPVVAVTRDFGAGGGEFSHLLAERLGVECFDNQIVDHLTKRVDTDKAWQKRLDEKVPRAVDDWVMSLFSKSSLTLANHQKHLIQVIQVLAEMGGVIIGRGGNLILADPHVFHVKIAGSKEVRAQRVAQREQMSLKKAKEKAISVDEERIRFVRKLYARCPRDMDRCDLTINSDGKTAEQMVNVTLYAMRQFGYLPES